MHPQKMYLFLVYVFKCLSTWIYIAIRVPGASGGQKSMLDPLELESQTAVNHLSSQT